MNKAERERCRFRPMPRNIESALEALEQDKDLHIEMSEHLVQHYITLKRAEQAKLAAMDEEERRIWLIERY